MSGLRWDSAQLVPSQFVSPLYHSLTLGRNGLPNHFILICSKASEATTYQERDGYPCNNLGPLRHGRHTTVRIRNAAPLASNISSIWMADGAYHGFSIVLFDVPYSTLSPRSRGTLIWTTCSRYHSQSGAPVSDSS